MLYQTIFAVNTADLPNRHGFVVLEEWVKRLSNGSSKFSVLGGSLYKIYGALMNRAMTPSEDDDHDEFNLTKKNSAMLFSNELIALYTLLAILFVASMTYIIIKAIIQSRRNGFLSRGTKTETTPINGKSTVNAA